MAATGVVGEQKEAQLHPRRGRDAKVDRGGRGPAPPQSLLLLHRGEAWN